MRTVIYLDMDGVVADFVGGMERAHGRKFLTPDLPRPVPYRMEEVWGLTDDEFWEPARGEEFWLNLQPLAHAEVLVGHCIGRVGAANVAFLSAASQPEAVYGKVRWLERHFPAISDHLVFTKKKYLIAHREAVLIDDYAANIASFREAGGAAITFPQPWNDQHEHAHQPVAETARRLTNLIEARSRMGA